VTRVTRPYAILFGDIHNHNAHGYGVGSIERSIGIARSHLDFFAFTGHSHWHDLVPMEGGREQHWLKGFQRLKDTWPRVQGAIADANRDGEFCAFLGFEWHSSAYGDQCVVFPQDHRPLHFCDHVAALREFCMAESALMIPHHLAYPRGRRGVNWDVFSEECTPVVEIYSEHGNSEDDRGPYPMVTHSFGGRESANTVRAALARQAASPVLWVDTIRQFAASGVTHIAECGPGKVLAGLVKLLPPWADNATPSVRGGTA